MKEYRPNSKLKRSYATMGTIYLFVSVFFFYYLYVLNKRSVTIASISSGVTLIIPIFMFRAIFSTRIIITEDSIKKSSPFQNRELLFNEITSLDITDTVIKINSEDKKRGIQFSTSYEGIEEIKECLIKAYKK